MARGMLVTYGMRDLGRASQTVTRRTQAARCAATPGRRFMSASTRFVPACFRPLARHPVRVWGSLFGGAVTVGFHRKNAEPSNPSSARLPLQELQGTPVPPVAPSFRLTLSERAAPSPRYGLAATHLPPAPLRARSPRPQGKEGTCPRRDRLRCQHRRLWCCARASRPPPPPPLLLSASSCCATCVVVAWCSNSLCLWYHGAVVYCSCRHREAADPASTIIITEWCQCTHSALMWRWAGD